MEYATCDLELLSNLPDFAWIPKWRELDGIRLAHIDEGSGDPVVFLHGEPTWSFLWRKVIPPVLNAGYRCIAPDMAGFGRSDKPYDLNWYTYDRHTAHVRDLFESLDLTNATLVVHDWGGPIGLRVATELSGRINRLVVMDTGIFTGKQKMTDNWHHFREFVANTEDLPVSTLVAGACANPLEPAVSAAYDAPFPNLPSKAGARAFPLMIPLDPDDPVARTGRRVLADLESSQIPVLVLWADGDPILPLETGRRFAARVGWHDPVVIPNAGHFLQEDQGHQIGELVSDWLREKFI